MFKVTKNQYKPVKKQEINIILVSLEIKTLYKITSDHLKVI